MPNDVTNHLLVEGDESEVTRFFEQAKGKNGALDFNSFVPMPSTVFTGSLGQEDERKFPGELNWYGWSNKHWGTKWNAYSITVTPPLVQFDTAWSLPEPFLLEMSKKFPSLTFTDEWIEETLESAGILVVKNGEIEAFGHESGSAWTEERSEYIHQLNLKHNGSDYISYLEGCIEIEGEDEKKVYSYYLNLAKESQTNVCI